MFCTTIDGLPGIVVAEMPRQQPRVGVVAAARRRADDDCDLLALVELLDRILRAARLRGRSGTQAPAATGRRKQDPIGIETVPRSSQRAAFLMPPAYRLPRRRFSGGCAAVNCTCRRFRPRAS